MTFEHSSAAQSFIISFVISLCFSCRGKQANLGKLGNVDLLGLRWTLLNENSVKVFDSCEKSSDAVTAARSAQAFTQMWDAAVDAGQRKKRRLNTSTHLIPLSLSLSTQGARGFPGTPGLPGIKGHRVSAVFHHVIFLWSISDTTDE